MYGFISLDSEWNEACVVLFFFFFLNGRKILHFYPEAQHSSFSETRRFRFMLTYIIQVCPKYYWKKSSERFSQSETLLPFSRHLKWFIKV